jgi:hypothetical protein
LQHLAAGEPIDPTAVEAAMAALATVNTHFVRRGGQRGGKAESAVRRRCR